MQSPLANISPVVKNLLIINIIFYIAMLTLPGLEMVRWLSAFYFDSPFFRPWQPITYMFMHSPDTFMHIFFNMFALVMFGTIIEQTLGFKRFVEFYFITGLGALALHMAVQAYEIYSVLGQFTIPRNFSTELIQSLTDKGISAAEVQSLGSIYGTPILGASGAIFGILLAFAFLYPNVELMIMFIPVPVKAKYVVPVYMLIELFLGVRQSAGDSVAHFAHLGGALFGFILLKIWGYRNSKNFF
ncbi:rhomboid family intramembrane serine protease [Mucilaginibacter hurinus]|uniref:Rhomboid family intramembrane serine protease n=1 Tax=Mucilaginibacter hurinus TaxID=2201324 RepID=A0A367GQ49_9SPHI|nr:rhomboid family intramembrane serine protease [Mucilaginibacter hurinus]RCH55577.1 rhomboid family intramembrane serine protease [Mucilaginibacter hurinus]